MLLYTEQQGTADLRYAEANFGECMTQIYMIAEITISALMLAYGNVGYGIQNSNSIQSQKLTTPSVRIIEGNGFPKEIEEREVKTNSPATLEAYIREYFKDTPILIEVARCESTFRHYDSKGNVIRGLVNRSDVGVMQINEYYHKATADRLRLDFRTLNGNLEYAKYLYEKYGASPWVHSSKCWGQFEKLAIK